MRTPVTVAEEIEAVEGFSVLVAGSQVSGDGAEVWTPYPFERAARKNWTVDRWRVERFARAYPGLVVEVLSPDGAAVSGSELLETLRARWAGTLTAAGPAEERQIGLGLADRSVAPPKAPAREPAKRASQTDVVPVLDYEHADAKRTNNPPAGLAHLDRDETPVRTLAYDPHLDPQLVWAGKAERAEVDVPAPSIHVHEELSAQKIVGSVRQQRIQQPLFDVDRLEPDQAVEFYRHDMDWSNRMILGDSLAVMASLVERERMAGQVQCVYMDPPYGIKYQSNFQPSIGNRNVTDGKDESLTREPEMIQAYRDTWELGVHSYLTYLRDRFTLARELLSDTGSIFVQIGDENAHLVRALLDEVVGQENFVATIDFRRGGAQTSGLLPGVSDHILWFARDRRRVRFTPLWVADGGWAARSSSLWAERKDGSHRRVRALSELENGEVAFTHRMLESATGSDASRFPIEFDGRTFLPSRGWSTNSSGIERLRAAGRLFVVGNSLRFKVYLDDFPFSTMTDLWSDTLESGFASDKRYVVQTMPMVVARCVLMTTDPGDLVLDPTCGSGTTAYVAEQYGRRWITTDTSRVALAIARERLLTSTFPYYTLRDEGRNVDGGFVYEELDRIALGSVARGEPPEKVTLVDQPKIDKRKTRVSGPFTVEALSRYAVDPAAEAEVSGAADTSDHVEVLLDALRVQGIPLPGRKPAKIESLTPFAAAGPLQAEGVFDADGSPARFAVSLGPRFGAVTMAQVGDALRAAIGFDLVVFAGFAVSADAQEKLGVGRIGSTEVALLLANPDLLVGDLLKNTTTSQTFRLYASPDVKIDRDGSQFRVSVEGVDSFDAATGEVVSYGRAGVAAWFLDDDYDGTVFRVGQAFFPVTNGWEKLSKALRGTVDADLVAELHSWTSLPFSAGESGRIAVRVISDDGNAAEVVLDLPGAS